MTHRLSLSIYYGGTMYTPATVIWVCSGQPRFAFCQHPGCQEWNQLMQRRSVYTGGDTPIGAPSRESKVFGPFANIVAHCTVTHYDDGGTRTPGWVTLRTYHGRWEIAIKEPDACAQMTFAADTLDDLLVLADTALGDPNAPWSHDQFLAARKPQKKR